VSLAAPVTLGRQGAEPREPLRYRWTAGTVQSLSSSSAGHTTLVLGGLLPDPDPFTTRQEASWKATASPGELVLELTRVQLSSDGPEAPPDLAPLQGLRGTVAVDERGRVSDADWSVPSGLDPRQTQQVDGLQRTLSAVVPLPEEAVGFGATWTVTDRLTSGGMDLTVVRTYELVERRGEQLVLSMAITLDAPPARVSLPAFEGDVQELSLTGSQRLELDLARPLPTRSGRSKLHVALKGRKGLLPISMTLDVAQDLEVR